MIFGCPGSQKFKQPYPENVRCRACGAEVEIWSDEASAECPKCKASVTRPCAQNCLEWCKYAKQCIGEELYEKYVKGKKKS